MNSSCLNLAPLIMSVHCLKRAYDSLDNHNNLPIKDDIKMQASSHVSHIDL